MNKKFKIIDLVSIEKNDNLLEIKFDPGDFFVTKNKFTFLGRYGTLQPLQRKMYRFHN